VTTLSDRLRAVKRPAIGREGLIAELSGWALTGEQPVTFVHGIPGIGKSTLLANVASRARGAGATVIELDCGAVEPTDIGVFDALARATGKVIASLSDVFDVLAGDSPLLLVLDSYERWRLFDTWVRQMFVPALPETAHVLIAGRFEPTGPWRYLPEWRDACRVIELPPLTDTEALAFLESEGLTSDSARRVNLIARGHPLALALAAAGFRDRPESTIDEAAIDGVTQALASVYLDAAPDPATREALEAASVTRRSTESLLAAQLGSAEAGTRAYAKLEALPFVRSGWDGLEVHEAVKQAGAARLRASKPARHRELRLAAWRQVQNEIRGAGENELWRQTADMLYLMEPTPLREGFFPSSSEALVLEPATEADLPAIRAISLEHDGPESTAIVDAWWEYYPRGVKVVRDRSGGVAGFRLYGVSDELDPALVARDPVLRAWLDDVAASEDAHLVAFMLRRWLSRDEGEQPSDVQALCWVECKTLYLKMRARLGCVFIAVRDLETFAPALVHFGFSKIEAATVQLDGSPLHSTVMHFGAGGPDGWLARLAAAEMGIDPSGLLDEDARSLLLDGVRVQLTPLEFEVMRCLLQQRGRPVSHADLVERVWGYQYTGESNVDAVVVRGLRAKLGARASMVETVRGVGYRLKEE